MPNLELADIMEDLSRAEKVVEAAKAYRKADRELAENYHRYAVKVKAKTITQEENAAFLPRNGELLNISIDAGHALDRAIAEYDKGEACNDTQTTQ